MALWGKSDTLASTPKYLARKATFNAATTVDATANTINLLASNTGFSTGDAVLYAINGGTVIGGLTADTVYYTRAVAAGVIALYDTYAHAIDTANTTGILDLTGAGVGTQTLQRTPLIPNTFADHNYQGQAIIFVDLTEAQVPSNRAKGLKNVGWWAYRQVTNADGSVSNHNECLVAMSAHRDTLNQADGVFTSVLNTAANAGDQADDVSAADYQIAIGTQPVSVAGAATPYTGTFAVVASATNSGALAYNWQVSTNGGTSWANASGGVYSNNTTATLTLTAAAKVTYNNYQYRCQVSSPSAAAETVTSTAATLVYA